MGAPKAWLRVGEEYMLSRVVRIVAEAAEPVVVVAAPSQDVPPLPPGARIVRDEVEGRGPLGGLAAGLAALEGEADVVYLSACDVPLLRAAFARRVLASYQGAYAPRSPCAVVPRANGRLHPLAAAYSLDVLPVVRARLAAGLLRVTDLLDAVPTRVLEEADLADLDSLRNVNTPEEYEAALRLI
jgi:molybdopterin-guanine dinucleotide biosynthesis protein A